MKAVGFTTEALHAIFKLSQATEHLHESLHIDASTTELTLGRLLIEVQNDGTVFISDAEHEAELLAAFEAGQSWRELDHPDDIKEQFELFYMATYDGADQAAESEMVELKTLQGTTIPFRPYSAPVENLGGLYR